MKKRLTVSASPGLLEFRSLKMPNSKRWVFSDDMSCPTSTNKSCCQENLNGVDSFSFGLFSIHHNHLPISQMTTAMTNMMSHHWWHQWQRWWGQPQPQRPSSQFRQSQSWPALPKPCSKKSISWRSRWEYNLHCEKFEIKRTLHFMISRSKTGNPGIR